MDNISVSNTSTQAPEPRESAFEVNEVEGNLLSSDIEDVAVPTRNTGLEKFAKPLKPRGNYSAKSLSAESDFFGKVDNWDDLQRILRKRGDSRENLFIPVMRILFRNLPLLFVKSGNWDCNLKPWVKS